MKKSEGRYDKYDKDEVSSVMMNRSFSPVETINLRNKDLAEIPYSEIEESHAKIIVLGLNKISKIAYLPDRIIKLELKCNNISKIQSLESCIFLQSLDLSNNRISRIENLQNNIFILELHLGDNHIKLIENLEMLKDLKRLNIENNLLSSNSSIRTLSLNTKLIFLVLKGNPLSIQGKYKPTITALLPKLTFLDYYRVSSQGFRKGERMQEFFSKPFIDSDTSMMAQLEVPPKACLTIGKRTKKLDSVQISTETQTFHPNLSTHADAQVQTFSDEPKKDAKPPSRYSREVKLPQFKSTNSNEMTRIRRYFRSVTLFKDFPSAFIETLIKSSEFKSGQESEIIIHSETIVEKIIVIIKGSMQYMNKAYAYGSHLFAESLVIPEETKSDLVCLEETEYFLLYKPELEKVFRLYPNQRELLMKNYLEKNISPNEFEIKLKTPTRKTNESKKPVKLSEKSKSLSKLNLKSLISSRTSLDIGLTVLDKFSYKENPLANKVKKDIDLLFKSADPFDFSLETSSDPIVHDSKFLELSGKVESLYNLYEKDIELRKSRKNIEEEARNFLKNGFRSDTELIAMDRESLRKIINSCNVEEEGENLWMYEHVKSLDRASEEIKNILSMKSAEVREEISSCQSALQTFLNQSSQSLSVITIKNYKVILNDCELLKQYDDPYTIVHEICGSFISSATVKQMAEEVINLMMLANKLKDAVSSVIQAQELDDTQQLILVRQHLQDQGLLLSDPHNSFHLQDRSISSK